MGRKGRGFRGRGLIGSVGGESGGLCGRRWRRVRIVTQVVRCGVKKVGLEDRNISSLLNSRSRSQKLCLLSAVACSDKGAEGWGESSAAGIGAFGWPSFAKVGHGNWGLWDLALFPSQLFNLFVDRITVFEIKVGFESRQSCLEFEGFFFISWSPGLASVSKRWCGL